MKAYLVEVSGFDLYGEYGYYLLREDAEKRFQQLMNTKAFLWKKHLRIREVTINEKFRE